MMVPRIKGLFDDYGSPISLTGRTALALNRIGSRCKVYAALKIKQEMQDADPLWDCPFAMMMPRKDIGEAKLDFVSDLVVCHLLGKEYTTPLPWTEWKQFDRKDYFFEGVDSDCWCCG